MSFYSDQATQFQQMAASIQTRLTNEGSNLDATTYASLEDQRDALLDNVNAMVTADIQATLAQLKLDQPRLAQCTASLNAAVKTLQKFDQIAAVVAAAVTLATAIASADPGAICQCRRRRGKGRDWHACQTQRRDNAPDRSRARNREFDWDRTRDRRLGRFRRARKLGPYPIINADTGQPTTISTATSRSTSPPASARTAKGHYSGQRGGAPAS